jgi:exosortase
MAETLSPSRQTSTVPAGHTLALEWMRADPLSAALVAALLATLAIFYAAVPIFPAAASPIRLTALGWVRRAWNPETHYEHGPLVPLIALFLVWNALPKLRNVRPVPSNLGLLPLLFGVGLFLISARSLQARLALSALPFLLEGIILFAAGKRYARVLLFPVCCLFFLIPLPGVDQATVRLQLLVTQAANLICNVIGIHLMAVGTTLRAVDQSFNFEIAGGCSGINSLMAITLMTAVFAHLTENRLWKQIVLFAASVPVAIIGNIARLVSIMIVAKCFGQTIAGGWFHDISAYVVSFPFAFGALCLVHKALNWPVHAGTGGAALGETGVAPSQAGGNYPLPAKAMPYDY